MPTPIHPSRKGMPSLLPPSTAPRKKSFLLAMRDNASAPLKLVDPVPETLQHILRREGEDAAITGGTRSLDRRLLALNLQATLVAAQGRRAGYVELPVSVKIA